jgi:hypothetical protein
LPSHSCVLRQHAIDLRLLQHDLRHEDVVRVVGGAPRQLAAVDAIPGQKMTTKALPFGGRRQRLRAFRTRRGLGGHTDADRRLAPTPYNSLT